MSEKIFVSIFMAHSGNGPADLVPRVPCLIRALVI
jgi:hypothetical protein